MKYQIAVGKRSQADTWRNLAIYWMVSPQAKERLEWIIFYHDVANQRVSSTAAYFGLSRKTIHKWLKRFDPHRIQSLEESSRRPKQLRTWEVTPLQEARVKTLREKHLRYGKAKLKVIYEETYGEPISTWKIERVVRKHHLYPDPADHKQRMKRRQQRKQKPKVRIHELETDTYPAGTLGIPIPSSSGGMGSTG
ncbi:MAG: hypothetical protein A2785_02845 [Candidatus Chisholmbacteria bacterium RIFCSPHIGHO2_01_FULL_49_18]|uniref:Insertion element IS150 protein InsJ-like helix-turn-helix domain-containing protein n=2 Tax=Candidatus Chisholmiibacteriota TaxID=1817900 RepID=A0A1G1VMP9_9BACT|nr:MAG: hypothetical protein A2785_02845 [Candidatus Chisholmbacteria bacterium RIFCSPHIGHO2_01_FULL_49_18]OGY21032.1 MAG: hypothetical protein A3A65_01845 [Candidatus Chisholmbacteria bacterium RIFCSPLOWO2_01_FULL_49_14]